MSEENQNKEEVISLEGLDSEASPKADNPQKEPAAPPPTPTPTPAPVVESVTPPVSAPPPEFEDFKLQSGALPSSDSEKKHTRNLKRYFQQKSEQIKSWGIQFGKYLVTDGRKDFIQFAKKSITNGTHLLKVAWNLPVLKKVYVLIFFAALFTLHKISQRFKMEKPLPNIGGTLVTTFEQVANSVYEYDSSHATWEEFESTIRLPNHTVTLNQVVVNLRSSSGASSPMAFLRLNVETSNKDAAVEVLDREKELMDLIQRSVEVLTYEDLNSLEGKNLMKIALRKKMNDVLNRGRVKRVYIQDIIFKP